MHNPVTLALAPHADSARVDGRVCLQKGESCLRLVGAVEEREMAPVTPNDPPMPGLSKEYTAMPRRRKASRIGGK